MNKIQKFIPVLMVLGALFLAVMPLIAAAQIDVGLEPIQSEVGYSTRDLRAVIGSIIKTVLGFLGVVAIIIMLIGGFKWMTAGGSEEKVGEAKKWLISGIIGLAIILAAYAITTFVIESLISATVEGGGND
ncbi:MAG: pilin [Patescibacteria group bacterium]